MGQLESKTGQYWVLFYQPVPEAGERVAAALVFRGIKGHTRVEYDSSFKKAHRLFPSLDPQLLAFYLDKLRSDLLDADDVESILNGYAPQLAASAPRRISLPLMRSTVEMLMARYIHPERAPRAARERADKVADEIEEFVLSSVGHELPIQMHVGSKDILGRRVSGTKRVALAVRNESGWTLIDGVDLNQLTPEQAEKRADDVSRSFWHYRLAAQESGREIRRVGVVLNGLSHLAPRTDQAHSYALHRFQTESDVAIDGASSEAGEQLRSVLQPLLDE